MAMSTRILFTCQAAHRCLSLSPPRFKLCDDEAYYKADASCMELRCR